MEQEVWKDIQGFEGYYQASTAGQVKALARQVGSTFGAVANRSEYVLKGDITKRGYRRYTLHKLGIRSRVSAHRIICETFIPNPEGKLEVNHIDGNKLNNNLKNLEWCSKSENEKHAYRTGLKKRRAFGKGLTGSLHRLSIPVVQLTLGGEFIARFECIRKAGRATNSQQSCISLCLSGKLKQTNGFRWMKESKFLNNKPAA